MNARRLHILIGACWLLLAGVVAVSLAALGNEEHVLARQRGKDLRQREELRFRHERLLAEIEWLSGEARLRQAVRQLDLPLERDRSLEYTPVALFTSTEERRE